MSRYRYIPLLPPGGMTTLHLLSAVLTIAIFTVDALMPSGASIGMLYVLVVQLGLWAPRRRFTWWAASIATLLTLLDPFISASRLPYISTTAERLAWVAAVNRPVIVLLIWVTAVVVVRSRDVSGRLERSVKDLADIKYALDQAAIVAITDIKGSIKYVNDKFCEISKYSREELLGQDHRIVNSAYHPKEYIRNLWVTIANGRIWRGEIRNRAKNGTIYWVDTTIVPFLDDRGKPYQYMAIRADITERKTAEAQLQEQKALTRLGQMAAIVAHEVKNPIAGIRGALQVIGGRMPPESRERAVMGDIVARLDSLNTIVQDLLLFARPRPLNLVKVELRPLLGDIATLVKRDPEFAPLAVNVDGAEVVIAADREQLQTVFLNLMLNAAQAAGGTGRVDVSVARRDGWCEVAVRDTGPGIPEDVRVDHR
jgi:PAS domain S-box-containing protein